MHALTNALKIINAFFANIVPIGDILWTFPQNFSWYANIPIIGSIPFAIYLLLGMGIYFSIRTKFVQFRYFKRGIQVLTKKKKPKTPLQSVCFGFFFLYSSNNFSISR